MIQYYEEIRSATKQNKVGWGTMRHFDPIFQLLVITQDADWVWWGKYLVVKCEWCLDVRIQVVSFRLDFFSFTIRVDSRGGRKSLSSK